MARFQFVGDGRGDIVEGKVALFLGHARVKHDLEQQIAKLAAQAIQIAAFDRIGDFIGFLDGIGRDRRESLCAVPFASRHRVPEPRHDAEEAVQAVGHIRTDNIYYVK